MYTQGVRGNVDSRGCNLQADSLSFLSTSQSKVSTFVDFYPNVVAIFISLTKVFNEYPRRLFCHIYLLYVYCHIHCTIIHGTIVTIKISSSFVQGVLADKVILGHLGPGLITQDLVVFQVRTIIL